MRRTRKRPRWARPERLAAAGALCLLLVCPAFAAEPSPAAQDPAQSASSEPAEGGGNPLTSLGAAGGTAVLVGAGAYTFVRKKWSEDKKEPREFVHYENHTREGTLTDEERRNLID